MRRPGKKENEDVYYDKERNLLKMQFKESKTTHHFVTSLIKSIIRILGYTGIILYGNEILTLSGILLIIAEVLGIIEEF